VNAVTIRRMIVFGVCTLGVAALYIVPSVAGSPSPVTMPRIADEPLPSPAGGSTVKIPQAGATGIRQPVDTELPTGSPPAVAPATAPEPTEEPTRAAARPTDRGRTAFDPDEDRDAEAPAAVSTISPAKVTADELSLSWPAASDNRRVIGYRIWLNGYEVATTAETRATLRWFNDDEGQHVVQIKAIDAAGNQSETWSTLLVTRPSPEPTEPPSSTTQPTTQPEPTPTPTPEPSESPSVQLAPQPTTSATKPAPKPARKPAPKPTTTGQ
jgi:hypothetical protein